MPSGVVVEEGARKQKEARAHAVFFVVERVLGM